MKKYIERFSLKFYISLFCFFFGASLVLFLVLLTVTSFGFLVTSGKETYLQLYPHFGVVVFLLVKNAPILQVILYALFLVDMLLAYVIFLFIRQKIKDIVTDLLKYVFALFIAVSAIEIISLVILVSLDMNPFKKHVIYNRRINGYFISQNTPNFNFSGLDGFDNYRKCNLVTDENGFVSDVKLTKEKAPGVVRIFITGGSAAFGSMQTWAITKEHSYPNGFYCFNSSIAGILKSDLSDLFPQKKFEIINAAVVKHTFHQGYFMYMSVIHEFRPDIVINIDGYNEAENLASREGYFNCSEKEVDDYLKLEVSQKSKRWPFSLYLASYFIDKQQQGNSKVISGNSLLTAHPSNAYYEKQLKPQLVKNCQPLLWVISAYENQLRQDSVFSIFCLQPMLSRRSPQKQLSPVERRLRATIEGRGVVQKDPAGDGGVFQFWDEYLAHRVDSVVVHNGGTFMDMNKDIAGLEANKEFYMDYCHMTPLGNKFVAKMLAEKVQNYLNGQNK